MIVCSWGMLAHPLTYRPCCARCAQPRQAVIASDYLYDLPPVPITPVGATQSSNYQIWYAPLAIDGNTDGNVYDGSCSHTNNDGAAWW